MTPLQEAKQFLKDFGTVSYSRFETHWIVLRLVAELESNPKTLVVQGGTKIVIDNPEAA